MASKWKKCVVKGCRQMVNAGNHRNKCAKHHYHQWRDNHPLKCSFHHLRKRAKERGKDFSLTFEQYRDFAIKTDYARLKGKTSMSLSIDRIKNEHGYHVWNIRAITLRENSRKLFTKMPEWMKEEIRMCEAGHIPESHRQMEIGGALMNNFLPKSHARFAEKSSPVKPYQVKTLYTPRKFDSADGFGEDWVLFL